MDDINIVGDEEVTEEGTEGTSAKEACGCGGSCGGDCGDKSGCGCDE